MVDPRYCSDYFESQNSPWNGKWIRSTRAKLELGPALHEFKNTADLPVVRSRFIENIDPYRPDPTNWKASRTPLHLVCRQIHYEVLGLLYSTTYFAFHSDQNLHTFINRVPEELRNMIKKVSFTWYHPYDHSKAIGLAHSRYNAIHAIIDDMPNIEFLHFDIASGNSLNQWGIGTQFLDLHGPQTSRFLDFCELEKLKDVECRIGYLNTIGTLSGDRPEFDAAVALRILGHCEGCSTEIFTRCADPSEADWIQPLNGALWCIKEDCQFRQKAIEKKAYDLRKQKETTLSMELYRLAQITQLYGFEV
jgi:hypothetical protein